MNSCIFQKDLVYLQVDDSQTVSNSKVSEYRINPLDILNIEFNNFSGNTIELLQGGSVQGGGGMQMGAGGGGGAMFYFRGYIVNDSGMVNLPLIGNVKAEGYTTDELESFINNRLKENYLQLPSVKVRLANFRVTIAGEVASPGVQYVFDKQFDILQAISQAGDLTDFADRRQIKLVRKNENDSEIVFLDMTKPELISSEYFYLKPNDFIYVQPKKAKVFGTNTRVFTFGVSIISFLLLIVNLTRN